MSFQRSCDGPIVNFARNQTVQISYGLRAAFLYADGLLHLSERLVNNPV